MHKLLVIIGSTRPGRAGLPVAEWFQGQATAYGAYEVQLVDLAALDLPFMNEPKHPKLGEYMHRHTKDWSATVAAADAFVFVTPEYNHGIPAPLKNALDYLHREWECKPAGVVSYGGVSAGTRGGEMLRQIATTLKMVVLWEAVAIPFVQKHLGADGRFEAGPELALSATQMLDELLRWSTALRTLRAGPAELPRAATTGNRK